MIKSCWNCQKKIKESVKFKSVCEHCLAYLHCCLGCQYYQIGKPNNCLIPGTDLVRDREINNYCEDFKVLEGVQKINRPSVDEISKKLFGDE